MILRAVCAAFQQDLLARLFHIFNHRFAQINLKRARLGVHINHGVLVAIAVFARGHNGLFDAVHHKVHRDAALLLEQAQRLKNFAHSSIPPKSSSNSRTLEASFLATERSSPSSIRKIIVLSR